MRIGRARSDKARTTSNLQLPTANVNHEAHEEHEVMPFLIFTLVSFVAFVVDLFVPVAQRHGAVAI
jgi:hypothetical protein